METSISRTSAQSFKCQCKMVAKLGKCVFLVPERFPVPKKYYAMPKSKISTLIRFLPIYWPNPESLVSIGKKLISLRKFWAQNFSSTCMPQKSKLGQKKIPPGINPKDLVHIRKCHKDKICCSKVSDRQTDRQSHSNPSSTEVENSFRVGSDCSLKYLISFFSFLGVVYSHNSEERRIIKK